MRTHFWRFAAILEEQFGVFYDRERETVVCPECGGIIASDEWVFEDYTTRAEEDYVVYKCPICGKCLTCRPIEA